MAFFDRTEQDIVSASIDELSQYTNITQLSPGSKTRFLLDTIAREQSLQHKVFDSNLMNAFIKYADSKFLDYLGDMLNLARTESTHASDDTDNFMFYVSTGTFGDINGSSSFTIPAGTIVSTVPYDGSVITPGLESQPTIQYVTTTAAVCSSGISFVYVPIRAVIEGRNSDVPRSVLNKHMFTTYTASSQNKLKCTNRFSVSNGEDRESDDSYRFRLANLFRAREMAVLSSIRLAALSVPGVIDTKEVICEQGPGTFSLYVTGTTPTTSPKLIQEVSSSVNSVTAFGIRPFILGPIPMGLEFVVAVKWNPRATTAQITLGYIAMRNILEKYLNETKIGEEVVFSDLVDVLLSASTFAMSIGDLRPNKFEEVYLYRNNPSGTGVTRSLVVSDMVTPLYNERVILETSTKYRGVQFLTR
jgi:uncharacterized phage protein gp47/JayE